MKRQEEWNNRMIHFGLSARHSGKSSVGLSAARQGLHLPHFFIQAYMT
jgi:hypothetical protein